MRLKQYPTTTQPLNTTDQLLIDGDAGVRTLPLADLPSKILDVETQEQYFETLDALIPPEQRRTIYRGKNLGSVVTDEQYASIANGSFKGLFLGDYWLINGIHWRIADFDYWYWVGGSKDDINHHLVIFPDEGLFASSLRNTNTTSGGFLGTKYFSTEEIERPLCKIVEEDYLYPAFGSEHIYQYTDAVSNGSENGVSILKVWTRIKSIIPTEPMIYGHYISTSMNSGLNVAHNGEKIEAQLALFRFNTLFMMEQHNRYNYWLRDIFAEGCYVIVTWSSLSKGIGSSFTDAYIRPVFGLK